VLLTCAATTSPAPRWRLNTPKAAHQAVLVLSPTHDGVRQLGRHHRVVEPREHSGRGAQAQLPHAHVLAAALRTGQESLAQLVAVPHLPHRWGGSELPQGEREGGCVRAATPEALAWISVTPRPC
jgi:hypothetical protein